MEQGIKNSWSLDDFSKVFGKIKKPEIFKNQKGEAFKSLPCVAPDGAVTFIGFSAKLGELTPEEIKAQKANLQVVELESGSYKLCKKGNSVWEDLDL